MWKKFIMLCCFMTLLAANSNTRAVKLVENDRQTYERIALVIGNNDYQEFKLSNAVDDSRAMKAFLESKNFKVIYAENADERVMRIKQDEFFSSLSQKSIAFIYYSGHGIQEKSQKYNGETTNYLIPIDNRKLKSVTDLDYNAISLNKMLTLLDERNHGLNMVVIDSCRSGFGRSFSRSASSTLANISAKGVFIAYATSSGTTASDNGRFRKSFIQHASQPLKLNDIFENVKLDLNDMSQRPSIHDDTVGTFYFTEKNNNDNVVERIVYRDRVASSENIPQVKQREGITIVNGLEYQNQAFEDDLTWHDAKDYCKALELHRKGWRLPNLHELHQLLLKYQVSNSKERPHYIRREFVENMPKNSWFWSSIKHDKDFSGVWGVNFRSGKKDWTSYRNNSYVMCVRGNLN